MPDLFGAQDISLTEQIQAVDREIGLRHRVYATRVTNHRMSRAQADREIARMQAVLATLVELRDNPADVVMRLAHDLRLRVDKVA